jgi:hypothetical protein
MSGFLNEATAIFDVKQSAAVPLANANGKAVIAWRVGRILYIHPDNWGRFARMFTESGGLFSL